MIIYTGHNIITIRKTLGGKLGKIKLNKVLSCVTFETIAGDNIQVYSKTSF